MNLLEQLKKYSKVVADSGDFESIKVFKPVDATTNPSLLYTASQDNRYHTLVEDALDYAQHQNISRKDKQFLALDKLAVNFGLKILDIVPGRVSTEVDARIKDTDEIIQRAKRIIALYEEAGADRNRVLIKIASTWEGIRAAEKLSREGIHCNMTLLFSLSQAIACADAGVQLISPFVGRILDWYQKSKGLTYSNPEDEPGVILVKNIYNYYKKFGYKTEIMAASFRNTGEIVALAGCDLMTISPQLMGELENAEGTLIRKLVPNEETFSNIERIKIDADKFKCLMDKDSMASEKLSEGIARFSDDMIKIEKNMAEILQTTRI